MGLGKSIFGKEISEITLDYLTEFFSYPQYESSVLEFKSGEVEIDKIYREVAAFLNTEGGILIIGTPRENYKDKNSGCFGQLVPSLTIRTQDALLHSIASNISPAPTGIKAKTLSLHNGNIYLLEIPQSVTPPHQVSSEGKYYIRLEREAKPAPHGIVEALFNIRQRPLLVGETDFTKLGNNKVRVRVILSNESDIPGENVYVILNLKGVKSVNYFDNLTGDYELKDDSVSFRQRIAEILVKGIRSKATVEITLRMQCLYCRLDLFAKNFKLNVSEKIFDSEKLTEYQYGLKNGTADGIDESAIRKFYETRTEWIRSRLLQEKPNPSGLVPIYNVTGLFNAFLNAGLHIPESYLDFLNISNGHTGINARGLTVQFLSDSDLIKQLERINPGLPEVCIGYFNQYPIHLGYKQSDKPVFSWYGINLKRDHVQKHSNSFYELIDDIFNLK